MHCQAGLGRTGTVAGCLLRELGFAGRDALDELVRLRWEARLHEGSPEFEEQRERTKIMLMLVVSQAVPLRMETSRSGRIMRAWGKPSQTGVGGNTGSKLKPPISIRPRAGPSSSVHRPIR